MRTAHKETRTPTKAEKGELRTSLARRSKLDLAAPGVRKFHIGELCGSKHDSDKLAIYVLIRKVREALLEYDITNDHLTHPAGGDCVRCRLARALETS